MKVDAGGNLCPGRELKKKKSLHPGKPPHWWEDQAGTEKKNHRIRGDNSSCDGQNRERPAQRGRASTWFLQPEVHLPAWVGAWCWKLRVQEDRLGERTATAVRRQLKDWSVVTAATRGVWPKGPGPPQKRSSIIKST